MKTAAPLMDRFADKLLVMPDGCWQWIGAKHSEGYGVIRADGRPAYAHRVAYELLVGPIPEGLDIDHLCRNRLCVNPTHLEPVTRRENLLRGDTITADQTRRTHCPQGHPYEGDNLFHDKKGRRYCRACAREHSRASYRRRKTGAV